MSEQIEQKKIETKNCFIITPIGKETDPIRRHIDGVLDEAIIPVLKDKYNYEIKVSHRMSNIGSINKQILESIYKSELVIANLTNLNPNVMYELAFRHATGKPVITIAEQGTNIPFDVIDNRTIFYINDPIGMRQLRSDLGLFLESTNISKNDYGPIIDTLKSIGYEQQFDKVIKEIKIDDNIASLLNIKFNEIIEKIDNLNINKNSIEKNGYKSVSIDEMNYISLDDEIVALDEEINSLYNNATVLFKRLGEDNLHKKIQKYRNYVNNLDLNDRMIMKYNTMLNAVEDYINMNKCMP